MAKIKTNYPHLGDEGVPGFDWSQFDDGWNGKSLKANKKIKLKKTQEANTTVVYSRESYVNKALKAYFKSPEPVSKEVRPGDVLNITDLTPQRDGTILASVSNGANNIVIDLEKEGKFLNNFTVGDATMTKQQFVTFLAHPEVKQQIIDMNLSAKVGTDTQKASIWDGYVEKINREMIEQINKNTQAYVANVVGANNGGLIVEIMNAVKAFLPGSLLGLNRMDVDDFNVYVGQSFEVMVEAYRPGWGFIVSRKKFIQHVLPSQLAKLATMLNENPDMTFTGKVTGATRYGVFVQIDEFITGMLHKSLVNDEVRDAMRNQEIANGTMIDVYVHRIEDGRVIFSNVCLAERDAVIAKREAEEEAEKESLEEMLKTAESNEQSADMTDVEPEIEVANV